MHAHRSKRVKQKVKGATIRKKAIFFQSQIKKTEKK